MRTPASHHASTLTVIICVRVGRLVVLLVKPVQEGDLRQQLEDAVAVVVQRRDLTVEQVQTLQALQALLHQKHAVSKLAEWT